MAEKLQNPKSEIALHPPTYVEIKISSSLFIFKISPWKRQGVSFGGESIDSARKCIKKICEYKCRIFFRVLVVAHLTYLQWPFKVQFFLQLATSEDPIVDHFFHFNKRVLSGHELSKKNWPWKFTVSGSNEQGRIYEKKIPHFCLQIFYNKVSIHFQISPVSFPSSCCAWFRCFSLWISWAPPVDLCTALFWWKSEPEKSLSQRNLVSSKSTIKKKKKLL